MEQTQLVKEKAEKQEGNRRRTYRAVINGKGSVCGSLDDPAKRFIRFSLRIEGAGVTVHERLYLSHAARWRVEQFSKAAGFPWRDEWNDEDFDWAKDFPVHDLVERSEDAALKVTAGYQYERDDDGNERAFPQITKYISRMS